MAKYLAYKPSKSGLWKLSSDPQTSILKFWCFSPQLSPRLGGLVANQTGDYSAHPYRATNLHKISLNNGHMSPQSILDLDYVKALLDGL